MRVIMLVTDLANEFLHQIFQRYETERMARRVAHDREMRALDE